MIRQTHLFTVCYTCVCSVCRHTGAKTTCLNLGSYNYLGFAEDTGPCADAAYQSTLDYGAGTCSPARELGTYVHCVSETLWSLFTFNSLMTLCVCGLEMV